MKKQIIILLLICLSHNLYAQKSVEDYLDKGVAYHDEGKYDKAIDMFKEGLKIDPNSSVLLYELSNSYMGKKSYRQAIKYANMVMEKNDDLLAYAYVVKGNALDLMGKTQESINLFEEAISQDISHYLIYYNLAINYIKNEDVENAEKNAIKAIQIDPMHNSSHYMIANLEELKGNRIPTVLSSYFFLMLESTSERAQVAYDILKENLRGNVSKTNSNEINITLRPEDGSADSIFRSVELVLSLSYASDLGENKSGSELSQTVDHTKTLFQILSELKPENNTEIWWTFYVPFYSAILDKGYTELFVKWCFRGDSKEAKRWGEKHEKEVDEFREWVIERYE